MKDLNILCVADEENKGIWDFYTPDKLYGLDLIISCGDLNPDYLQFLVTMSGGPLLYIHGNHDNRYTTNPPLGCVCIEDQVYNYKGLRILGLGGSMRYKPGENMYSEAEMKKRINRLAATLMITGGFDVLVSHAPARGYGDMEDLPHLGFSCFNDLLMKYKPKYMLHGHVHKTYGATSFQRVREHPSGTKIINCYDLQRLQVKEEDHPPFGKTGSSLYDLYMRLKGNKDF